MSQELSSEQKQYIQSLEYEVQKANARVEYLAERLGQRELELSEMDAQLQTFKNAYALLQKEKEDMEQKETQEAHSE
ncbi:hypothetical protein [Shouchella clausii]|uniref:hypothetical protein n=1 Tax=Shouchella clausii TaxID=79880 RepID=UPI000BA5470A|nr:hypothetical protein [Shouchella clausii]MEB5481658.1 hypothetical protein [Shouchella clausii]PAD12129.1 hypothetical protein CHH74_16960 [Shouchella clausii]PAE92465.1 hypothetical protein CHH71_20205 [Shouchella clausii]